MARYSKNASGYIQRKRHQLINDGAIIERDWTTLGERHVIEPGKQKVYSDGGFLFTESRRPSIKKRSNTEAWSSNYALDDLSDTVNDSVNTITIPDSNDIISYAYYGSSVELLRASLEDIAKWFPGKAWTDGDYITKTVNTSVNSYTINELVSEILNCYNAGITSKFVSLSYTDANFPEDFTLKIVPDDECDGIEISSNVVKIAVSIELQCVMDAEAGATKISQLLDMNGAYQTLFSIQSNEQKGSNRDFIVTFDSESKISESYLPGIYQIKNPFNFDFFKTGMTFTKYENELRNIPYSWKRYYIKGREILSYDVWMKRQNGCESDYEILYDITLTYAIAPSVSRYNEFYTDYNVDTDCIDITTTTDTDTLEAENCLDFISTFDTNYSGHIYGIKKGSEVIWCTDIKGFTLVPMPSILQSYFNTLSGFERVLLTRKSNPVYTCTLRTPISKGDTQIGYYFLYRDYTFPSNGYCILCDGFGYNEYVTKLYNMANIMDENYTDNIWRNMTHEAIKNFDWTYTKDYEEGDEADNIFGGTRLQEVLRIYGRFFDDIKRYIDNISVANVVTYDGQDNIPSAQLSDKASLSGWEVYSTKLNNNDNIALTSDFIAENVTKQLSRWNCVKTLDNDLVFPGDSQSVWFNDKYPDATNQNIVDNHFMRNLTLNGKSIFRSKGTKQAIDMVFALFGLGDDIFSFEEAYYGVGMREADETIYAYTIVNDIDDATIYTDVSTDTIITLTQYINSLGHTLTVTDETYITIDGKYYCLTPYTLQSLCEYINDNKIFVRNYEDDPYSGVPLKKIRIGNTDYIVPYFTQDKIYDGNVQFETNGGWGKWNFASRYPEYTGQFDESYFSETLPYTPVLQNCNALLGVNPYIVNGKTMYYVMDINDITDFTEGDVQYASHYFKLIDANNPQQYVSWSNVPIIDNISPDDYDIYCNERDEDTNFPIRPIYSGVSYNDYRYIQYLETIKFDNLGNNPHTGEGKYDYGYEFAQYLQMPFYYSINYYGFKEEYLIIMAKYITFFLSTYTGDKIVKNNYDNVDDNGNLLYYIPSKLLKITCKYDDYSLSTYFQNVIFKYISQVIPSTTILVFGN